MIGERGPVDLSTVEVGNRVSLVRRAGFQPGISDVEGIVTARRDGEVQVKLTQPRKAFGGAYLRMTVRKPEIIEVFDAGPNRDSVSSIPDRTLPRVGGHVLPPGIRP